MTSSHELYTDEYAGYDWGAGTNTVAIAFQEPGPGGSEDGVWWDVTVGETRVVDEDIYWNSDSTVRQVSEVTIATPFLPRGMTYYFGFPRP